MFPARNLAVAAHGLVPEVRKYKRDAYPTWLYLALDSSHNVL